LGQRYGHIEVDGAKTAGLNFFPGRKAVGVLRVAADVADTQTVTIGSDVYEFDRAANGVTAGRIAVTGHADDTPANATNALITAINTYGTEPITAIDISDNEILLVADNVGAVTTALAETLAGANNVFSAAAMAGGADAAVKRVATAVRVPTATEVALGNLHVALPFTPTVAQVVVRVTATGALTAWDGDIHLATNRVTINNDATIDWAATDTIWIIAYE
jgi:hypothetical protein